MSKKTFIANDGKEFKSNHKCKKHNEKLKKECKHENFQMYNHGYHIKCLDCGIWDWY